MNTRTVLAIFFAAILVVGGMTDPCAGQEDIFGGDDEGSGGWGDWNKMWHEFWGSGADNPPDPVEKPLPYNPLIWGSETAPDNDMIGKPVNPAPDEEKHRAVLEEINRSTCGGDCDENERAIDPKETSGAFLREGTTGDSNLDARLDRIMCSGRGGPGFIGCLAQRLGNRLSKQQAAERKSALPQANLVGPPSGRGLNPGAVIEKVKQALEEAKNKERDSKKKTELEQQVKDANRFAGKWKEFSEQKKQAQRKTAPTKANLAGRPSEPKSGPGGILGKASEAVAKAAEEAKKKAAEEQKKQQHFAEQKRYQEQVRQDQQKLAQQKYLEQQKLAQQKQQDLQKKPGEQKGVEDRHRQDQQKLAQQRYLDQQKKFTELKRMEEQQKKLAEQKRMADQHKPNQQKLAQLKHPDEQPGRQDQQKLDQRRHQERQKLADFRNRNPQKPERHSPNLEHMPQVKTPKAPVHRVEQTRRTYNSYPKLAWSMPARRAAVSMPRAGRRMMGPEEGEEVTISPDMEAKSEQTLVVAALDGDLQQVAELLNKGSNVNEKDSRDVTPLMAAVSSENTELVKLLLDKNADVNARDKEGATALMVAAESKQPEIARLLLKKGADVNAKTDKGWTALMGAVLEDQPEIAKLLIAKGADVNAKDGEGITPLKIASENKRTDLVKMLEEKGATAGSMKKQARSYDAYGYEGYRRCPF
jgi:hypothetical protein